MRVRNRNATRHMFVMSLFISLRMNDEKIMRDTAMRFNETCYILTQTYHCYNEATAVVYAVYQLRMCRYCVCLLARSVGCLMFVRTDRLRKHSPIQFSSAQYNTTLKITINSCRFHCEGLSNSWKRYEFS